MEKVEGIQDIQIVSLVMVKEKTLQYQYGERVDSPKVLADIFTKFIGDSDREILALISLNVKNKINAINIVSIGSLNSSIVHPREVFTEAIKNSSASIIICHNHPSGDPTPSNEDINITYRIRDCGKLLGIELVDHIIIGEGTYVSLKEKGIL